MNILLTGAKGQLAYDVITELKKRNNRVTGTDIEEMDITDRKSVISVITENNPDVVIHCAAWTAVDSAEENKKSCRLVNFTGTKNIAEVCKNLNCKMIYISTDYVFSGNGSSPWETDDKKSPINVYGQTKYEGELEVEKLEKHYIVRTAWVFGKNGKNFVKTVLKLAKEHNALNIVNDQVSTPTYTHDLAVLLADMAENDKYGTYHATNEGGYISRYDFVIEILKQAGIGNKQINPVSSDEFKTLAKRPLNSRLSKASLTENGFTPLPDWKDALRRFLIEIGEI